MSTLVNLGGLAMLILIVYLVTQYEEPDVARLRRDCIVQGKAFEKRRNATQTSPLPFAIENFHFECDGVRVRG